MSPPTTPAWKSNGAAGEGRAGQREKSGTRALRVLHVVPQLAVGGTEAGVVKLLRGLSREKFEQYLCAMKPYDAGLSWLSQIDSEPLIAGGNQRGFQISIPRLVRVIRQVRPDVVHSRNWGAIESVAAARWAGVPVVIHSEHGYELDILSGLPWRRRLLRRGAYAAADAVFAVTRELRDYHARQAWVSPEQLGVIYNGVDTDRFKPRPAIRERMRCQLGFSAGVPVIGSVGRLVPIKNYTLVLAAAKRLVDQGIDVKVLLVGDGPERKRLEEFAESAGIRERVVFTGSRDDVAELLNVMDIFVLSSVSEGMSNTLLEAMATGLPVIATAAGGNVEVVDEREGGALFPTGNTDVLVDRLAGVVQNREVVRMWGAASRERAVRVFGLRTMLDRYTDLYLDAAARRGVHARPGVK